jgi:peptidoglycan/LPS O-acetylase OafA/YrhL
MMIVGVLRPTESSDPPSGSIAGGFAYLGRISYGLYVFHRIALDFTDIGFSSRWRWAANLTVPFAITLLVAAVSYRFLESPFLRLKRRFTFVPSTPD